MKDPSPRASRSPSPCKQFQVISGAQPGSVVELSVSGTQGGFIATARIDSGPESRTFSHDALTSNDARFTFRRQFYVVTFVVQFLSEGKTKVTLCLGFPADPPGKRCCTVSGTKKDRVAVRTFDLES